MTARSSSAGPLGADAAVRMLYSAYSSQDLGRLLALVTEDVDWPDADRRLQGRAEVADYWRRQWARIRTRDEPAVVAALSTDVRVVRVDQVVRDLAGAVVSRGTFAHVLHLRDGLVSRLDIVPLHPVPPAALEEIR